MNILFSLKYKNLKNTPDHLTNKNKEKDDLPITMKIAPNNFFTKLNPLVKKLINNPTTLENRLEQQKIFDQEIIS